MATSVPGGHVDDPLAGSAWTWVEAAARRELDARSVDRIVTRVSRGFAGGQEIVLAAALLAALGRGGHLSAARLDAVLVHVADFSPQALLRGQDVLLPDDPLPAMHTRHLRAMAAAPRGRWTERAIGAMVRHPAATPAVWEALGERVATAGDSGEPRAYWQAMGRVPGLSAHPEMVDRVLRTLARGQTLYLRSAVELVRRPDVTPSLCSTEACRQLWRGLVDEERGTFVDEERQQLLAQLPAWVTDHLRPEDWSEALASGSRTTRLRVLALRAQYQAVGRPVDPAQAAPGGPARPEARRVR